MTVYTSKVILKYVRRLITYGWYITPQLTMVLREFRYKIRNITFIAKHVQYLVIYRWHIVQNCKQLTHRKLYI